MSRRAATALGLVGVAVLGACASAPEPAPVAPVVAPPPVVKTAPEYLAEAQAAFAAGDYAAAVEGYEAVLDSEPANGTALYNRALAYQRRGDFKAAERAYERTLEAHPNDVEAALNLGAVKKERGDIAGAVALYRRFLKSDEFNPRLLNNLAALYRADGRYKQATRTVRKLLMRDSDNLDAYKNLALIYFDQQKYRLAQTILDNALRMAREQNRVEPDIYVNLGRVYLANDDPGGAMAAFKQALALNPDHVVAHYNVGAVALGHHDYQTAANAYEVCAKAWPEKFDVWASLGYAYQGLKAFDKAETNLAKSRELLGLRRSAAGPTQRDRLAREDERLLLQLVVAAQGAAHTEKALAYADEYRQIKGLLCGEDDVEGFCGRYNGIRLTLQLEKEAAQADQPVSP